jgi:hypothetical protein
MFRRLLFAAALALMVFAGFAGTPAHAATATHPAVGGKLCTDRGVTNYYVHRWAPFYPEQILNSTFVYHEHACTAYGFRLYKSTANTPDEVKFARSFLAGDRPEQPTVFCRTSPGHAYFLDLGFYWGVQGDTHLTKAERNDYTPWTHRYAHRHGCRLFLPKSGA